MKEQILFKDGTIKYVSIEKLTEIFFNEICGIWVAFYGPLTLEYHNNIWMEV